MSRKKKEQPLIEGLEITAVAAEGNALGRHGEKVVFVAYGAPGDVADVRVVRSKKQWAEARIERLIEASPLRVEPRCIHFGLCGGCKWQHLSYDEQLRAKRQQVIDVLERIAKVPFPEVAPTLGSDPQWGYRNKMEYTFSARRWLTFDEVRAGVEQTPGLGFHVAGAFDKVLNLNECCLADDFSNALRTFVRDYALERGYTFYDLRNHTGLMRTLMVRTLTTGETLAFVAFGEDRPGEIEDVLGAIRGRFPELTSLVWAVNDKMNDSMDGLDMKLHSGRAWVEETLEHLRYRVQPKSFFQTNTRQALELYRTVRTFAQLTGDETVYDLYTGTGSIALFLARDARKVVGVEYVEDAVEDARVNARENGIDNCTFTAGDMKDVLNAEFIAANGKPDVMVVDPPRAGMHEDVVKVILAAEPRRIVYVSCNPATQARDIALLAEKYDVERVQPVDMFPHTHHVENVVSLTLR